MKSFLGPRTIGVGRPRKRPRWAFSKGAVVGLLTWVPLCGVALWVMGRFGLVSRTTTLIEGLRMTSIFASLPAVLTAGGVGRLAAYASTDGSGGRRRATMVASRAMAVAGAALTFIAATPLGGLPLDPWGWVMIGCGGVVTGMLVGALIGLVCGGPLPSLAEFGTFRIEPIEWTRDLLGWEDRPPAVRKNTDRDSAVGSEPPRSEP